MSSLRRFGEAQTPPDGHKVGVVRALGGVPPLRVAPRRKLVVGRRRVWLEAGEEEFVAALLKSCS